MDEVRVACGLLRCREGVLIMDFVLAQWKDAASVHLVRSGTFRSDSCTAKTHGPVVEGWPGGGDAECGVRLYGVAGMVGCQVSADVTWCVGCDHARALRWHVETPVEWMSGVDRAAYWDGVDAGRDHAFGLVEDGREGLIRWGAQRAGWGWELDAPGREARVAGFDVGVEEILHARDLWEAGVWAGVE